MSWFAKDYSGLSTESPVSQETAKSQMTGTVKHTIGCFLLSWALPTVSPPNIKPGQNWPSQDLTHYPIHHIQ